MQEQKRDKLISVAVSVVAHVLLVLCLLWFGLRRPPLQEESGVLLMVGLVDEAGGEAAPGGVAAREPAPVPATPAAPPAAPAAAPASRPVPEPPLVTANDDDAPAVAARQENERRQREAEARARADAEARAKAEAERKAREEAERRRREEEERQRKEAEAIEGLLAGAFGSTAGDGSHGAATGAGAQGTPRGNAATGATQGTAGWGTVDLGGRGLAGTLPRPAFNVNASGVVVVAIAVNAAGNVVSATVGKGTTTSDRTLREAALAAARQARFAPQPGAATQTGTITYRFDSDN